jgi:drug/metabolite transporter (DMT)-like permease
MAQGIEYALAAMICFGLADFVYKRSAGAGVQAHHFLMLQAWFFAPTVLLYGVLSGTLAFETPALWGAAAGLFVYAGLYYFARSLQGGAISINAPIFRLSFTITAALAVWLLHEPLTPLKFAGLALALIAAWLLLGGGGAPAHRASRVSLAQVLVAMVALGIANFIYKIGVLDGASPASLLVAQAAVFISLATGFACAIDRGLRPPRAALPRAAIAAMLLVFAFILLIEGLAYGQASVLVPIAQMGFIVTSALGVIVLRESFGGRKGAGLATALAALACLARS